MFGQANCELLSRFFQTRWVRMQKMVGTAKKQMYEALGHHVKCVGKIAGPIEQSISADRSWKLGGSTEGGLNEGV